MYLFTVDESKSNKHWTVRKAVCVIAIAGLMRRSELRSVEFGGVVYVPNQGYEISFIRKKVRGEHKDDLFKVFVDHPQPQSNALDLTKFITAYLNQLKFDIPGEFAIKNVQYM